MTKLRAILTLVLLAGCAVDTRPVVLAATPRTYHVEVPGLAVVTSGPGYADRYQMAVEGAEAHCAGHGRSARLMSETPLNNAGRVRLLFDCQ